MDDLTPFLDNPRVREFLDRLAAAEGTAGVGDDGYNARFGGGTFDGYDAHPRLYRYFKNTEGRRQRSSAAGRYQFVTSTWNSLAKRLGLEDFSPTSQDLAAIELIREAGALDDVLIGDYEDAVAKLGNVWASLPSSTAPQRHVTMDEFLGREPAASEPAEPVPEGGEQLFVAPAATAPVLAGLPAEGLLPADGDLFAAGDMMPVQPVNIGGQQFVALPETQREMDLMRSFGSGGHDERTQQLLTNALASITAAQDTFDNALFESFPTDLDEELLDLIDRA